MKRSIIKQGSSTLTLSLPSKWTKQFNLKGGDELDVEEVNQSLIISAVQRVILQSITVDVSNLPDNLLWRYFNTVYVTGYDEIVFKFSLPETLNLLQTITDSHIGTAIIDQSTKSCTVKEIAQPQPEDFDKLLRRLFHMLTAVRQDLFDATKKSNWQALATTQNADLAINKIAYYCMRLLNKAGHPDMKHMLLLDDVIRTLERLGDSYKHIAKHLGKKRVKLSPQVIKVWEDVNELTGVFFNLYYTFNKNQLIDAFQTKKELLHVIDSQLSTRGGADALLLSELNRIILLVQEIGQAVIALNL